MLVESRMVAIPVGCRSSDPRTVAGVDDGELVAEPPGADPNPAVEIRARLPDGTEFKAVWSYLRASGVAKLVTAHFFERGRS